MIIVETRFFSILLNMRLLIYYGLSAAVPFILEKQYPCPLDFGLVFHKPLAFTLFGEFLMQPPLRLFFGVIVLEF